MSTKTKLNTLVDGNREPVVRDDWLKNIGPKQGVRSVAEVDEYLTSEATARQLDPPGSAKAVAKAAKRAHGMAVGLSHSGLTFDALCEMVAPLCPRYRNGSRASPESVAVVIKGLLSIDTLLTDEAE